RIAGHQHDRLRAQARDHGVDLQPPAEEHTAVARLEWHQAAIRVVSRERRKRPTVRTAGTSRVSVDVHHHLLTGGGLQDGKPLTGQAIMAKTLEPQRSST